MMRAALIAIALAACGSHEWKPPENVDHIEVKSGLVARIEPDATISVTALVTLDGQTAAGAVRLRSGDMQTALASPHVRLARARAWPALAEMLAATPERASEAAKSGNDELYHFAFGDDGYHLRAGASHAAHADADATRLMLIALRSNIHWYVNRHHAELW